MLGFRDPCYFRICPKQRGSGRKKTKTQEEEKREKKEGVSKKSGATT